MATNINDVSNHGARVLLIYVKISQAMLANSLLFGKDRLIKWEDARTVVLQYIP